MNIGNPIYNIWLINKRNSLCILQKNYSFKTNIDNDLFSGFITAIFNFSEELSGESVKSISMGSIKLFYKTTNEIILALAANKFLVESDVAPILDNLVLYFKNEGYDHYLNEEICETDLFTPFTNIIDDLINKSSDFLNERISQNKFLEKKIKRLKEEGAQTKFSPLVDAIKIERRKHLTDEEVQTYKESLIDAIENAEQALYNKNYQDAIIYYGVAAGLFKDLGDHEKSEMFKQHVINLKEKLLQPDFNEDVPLINTVNEEEQPVLLEIEPLIPLEALNDEKIRNTLKKAYDAERKRKYGEASTYYNSASGLFILKKDHQNAEKCSNYAKEILYRQQNEVKHAVHLIGGEFPDPIQKSSQQQEYDKTREIEKKELDLKDQDLNLLLNKAIESEELKLYEKAIGFYKEIINKLEFYEDFDNIQKFKEKIYQLNQKLLIKNYEFKEIIPIKSLKDEKTKKNLLLAYKFEKNGDFSQASLYYNIVAGLFSINKDENNAKKCSIKAKELLKLKDFKF